MGEDPLYSVLTHTACRGCGQLLGSSCHRRARCMRVQSAHVPHFLPILSINHFQDEETAPVFLFFQFLLLCRGTSLIRKRNPR